MPDREDRWFDALHSDLKSLNDKVRSVEILLSEMKGEKIGGRMEKMENKVSNLEDFKSRAIGAFFILGLIWPPLCAVIVWWITR